MSLVILANNTKAFYHPTRFIAILLDQQKKQGGEEPLITAQEAEKLKGIVLIKIEKLVADNKLQKEKGLVFFLFRWKEWAGEEKVKEYIKKLVSTREGLLIFLKGFVGKVLSTAGNYYRLDKKGIEGLYPLAEIEGLVKAITDEELKKFDDKDKQAIDLFSNPPKHDW